MKVTTLLLGLIGSCMSAHAMAAAATWNPADLNIQISLSNGNLTATSSGTAIGTVRGKSPLSSGKVCYEVKATTISRDWAVGIADGSYVLGNPSGIGSDAHAIAIYPNITPNPQGTFFNNTNLNTGVTQSVNNEVVTMCVDLSAKLFWVTDTVMRAASQVWNNAVIGSSNPATGTGGASFAGLTCPCYMVYNNDYAGVAVLNSTGPFAVSLPSGFSAWSPLSTGHPIAVIMGKNDEPPSTPPLKEKTRYVLNQTRRRAI